MTRILIVDDDPDHRHVAGAYLELAGYDVDEAEDGAAAIAWMNQSRPDLVLLDLQMPELDGFGVLRKMRDDPKLAAVPVILLTAMAKGSLKVRGLELGADDYLTKPFDKAELLARVRARLRSAARQGEQQGAMRGELGSIRLADVVQTLELMGRPSRLRLMELGGEICLSDGRLTAASWGKHTGMEALVRLMLLERGPFVVDFVEQPASANDGIGISHALMKAGVELDEVSRILSRIGRENPIVSLRREGAEGLLAGIPPLTPARLLDMLTGVAGPVQGVAEALVNAFEHGMLFIVE